MTIERIKIQDVVTALSSTVNDLELCGRSCPAYVAMISSIRAFPHCNLFYIQDCVTGITSGTDSYEGVAQTQNLP